MSHPLIAELLATMTNNDILRRLRYIFQLSDSKMLNTIDLADGSTSKEELMAWFKKEDEGGYKSCDDTSFATFLNGLIISHRGKRDGPQPTPEKKLTNNMIFVKLKIALNLKSDDIIEILRLADFELSPHELSAFFRKPGNKHYRECKDQILRNFLMGLQIKLRGQPTSKPAKAQFDWG